MKKEWSNTSTKLVKCELFNKKQDQSIRFIELEKLKLWMYMMEQKHGFSFGAKNLYLWVNAAEYKKEGDLYGVSHQKEDVNLILLMLFDEKNKFSFSINRFVPNSETEQVKNILLSHVNKELIASDSVEMKVYPGYALSRSDSIEDFLCGLSDSDDF